MSWWVVRTDQSPCSRFLSKGPSGSICRLAFQVSPCNGCRDKGGLALIADSDGKQSSVIKGLSMRVLKHTLAKSAVLLLLGAAGVQVAHAQSDIAKTFVGRLVEQVTKLENSCAE